MAVYDKSMERVANFIEAVRQIANRHRIGVNIDFEKMTIDFDTADQELAVELALEVSELAERMGGHEIML